jgi:hypothetical protein
MYYDTIEKQWHSSKATLPNARGQTVGLRTAPDSLLAEHGIITGETEAVPDGMVHTGAYTIAVTNGAAIRTPVCITPEEAQAQAQAAFGLEVQTFLGGNEGKNLTETVQFFALIQTYFPQIVLPTTYYDARAAMNDAIEAALDIGDMLHANRLQNQSRIIQDIYGRLLEPNGWTGIKLAQLAQALQGGQ